MKKIYLASPYTHPKSFVRQWRYQRVTQQAAKMVAAGHCVFSPITHCHSLIRFAQLPGEWEFWEAYDRSFLEWCDELHVYKAAGWQESTGVQAEIAIAQELGKPVVYIDVEGE